MAEMGLGDLGQPNVIFKRKFRWGFRVDFCGDSIPEHFVKIAARPNISIEETEINVKNAKTWIPGKASWEQITVQYYDVVNAAGSGSQPGIMALYSWLSSVYDFRLEGGGIRGQLNMGAAVQDYAGQATLKMYDGCGVAMETWRLWDAWPQAINFGDLDYASSEEATVELTLRYSDVQYTSCEGTFGPCGCTACGGGVTSFGQALLGS